MIQIDNLHKSLLHFISNVKLLKMSFYEILYEWKRKDMLNKKKVENDPSYFNSLTYTCLMSMYVCPFGWGDFLQKHASYCGNLGTNHKDE